MKKWLAEEISVSLILLEKLHITCIVKTCRFWTHKCKKGCG